MQPRPVKLLAAGGVAAAFLIGGTAPVFGHDCINVTARQRTPQQRGEHDEQ